MLHSTEFYTELGNLFYAIAAADRKIRPEEKKILHDEVQYGWKHFESSTDRFGSDRAYVIEYEFDTLEDIDENAGRAFESFVNYFHDNPAYFDDHTRKRIFNSARHIAESARKINASELDFLVRLKKLLAV